MTATSIIESMAADFYAAWAQDTGLIVSWPDLEPNDRRRFIDAMVKTIEKVPDRCQLRRWDSTLTFILGQGRQAILDDHTAASIGISKDH